MSRKKKTKQQKINHKISSNSKQIQKEQFNQKQIAVSENQKEEIQNLSQEQIDLTIKTIQFLCNRLDIYRSAQLRNLRKSIYPLFEEKIKREGNEYVKEILKGNNYDKQKKEEQNQKNLNVKISTCIMDNNMDECLQLLSQLQNSNQQIPLGALQRWVRDLNINTLDPDKMSVRVLDSILRCASKIPFKYEALPEHHVGLIFNKEHWQSVPLQSFTLPPSHSPLNPTHSYQLQLIHFQKAQDRKPVNLYDLKIFTNKIPYILDYNPNPVQKIHVPFVDNAFVLTNVLTPQDCLKIIEISEHLGFEYDIPIGQQIDERAQGCVWVVDEGLSQQIFKRCLDQLPIIYNQTERHNSHDGLALGLNRRWRIYRYNQGNVYRPHIDGAWPGSGVDKNDQYVYDYYENQWSKLTFIIYLNEDFQGGSTTFFIPSKQYGNLDATGVRPRIGTALLFRHGEGIDSLVHEGSNISQGTKYIIRTDILYKK